MGSIFFTTMNKTALSYALGIFAAEKVMRIVPDGAHDWNKFIAPEELGNSIIKSNYQCITILSYFTVRFFSAYAVQYMYAKAYCTFYLNTNLFSDGFTVKLIHGMTLNPLSLKWKWISRTDINYAIHGIKSDPSHVKTAPEESDSDSSDSDSNK